ncbi:hypothetical protein ES708_08947 [subsurface metagenome]
MKHKLLYPSRYRRGDRQNIERIRAAHQRGRKQQKSARAIQPAAGMAVSRAGAALHRAFRGVL